MATIKDIANKLGISVSTVSKGLNGAKDISASLRQEVLETAVEMGYTGRKTKRQSQKRLCIFIENMDYESTGTFGYDIVLGFRQAAYKEQFEVVIQPVSHEFQVSEKYDTYMLGNGFSGAFLLGFSLEDPWMEQIKSTAFSTVLLDNFIEKNPNVGYIGTDSEEGIAIAIEHLTKLGHEKIAFLDGSRGSMVSDLRMIAYLDSMSSHRLPVDPNLAVYGYFVADAAHYHVPTFLDLGATAILCGNDLIASGVIEECKRSGYKVPEDISVIGFDDLPLAQHLDPPLTTVKQDRIEIGKCGFYILRAMNEHISLSKNLLRPSLSVRSSTAIAKPRLAKRHSLDKDSVISANPELYAQFQQHRQIR
ncbi:MULTISPECIES: LacI family DNA-binding transcriptional regulator [Butyrivibrio]|jgi:LacI family transcriptional regulator|uniref:LacI family DNA-binding transcriptional regulator n=1 Tax=Butyrivibrio TaxID=830 RepID=UPI0003FA7B7D|nr:MULTISPECIES: LacI family DNA-binding transcriptional regulator [Butyrivibrio]MCR4635263.1 LacI family transcriptional regulator [Butyrivibrio sp.]SEQ44214.1 LacI family transcriptional regulator [Butyrivibrio sp. TB]